MTAARRNLDKGIGEFSALDNDDKEWVLTQLETSPHLPPYLLFQD